MGPETDLPDDDFDVGYAAYGSPQKPPLDHAGQPGMPANGGMFFGPGPPIQTTKVGALASWMKIRISATVEARREGEKREEQSSRNVRGVSRADALAREARARAWDATLCDALPRAR